MKTYTNEELNRIAKSTVMELELTTIPDDYPEGDGTDAQNIMWYNVDRDYLDLVDTNWNAFMKAIQPELCKLALKVYALSHSSIEVDPDILNELQDMLTNPYDFGCVRHMASSRTLNYWNSLGFTEYRFEPLS